MIRKIFRIKPVMEITNPKKVIHLNGLSEKDIIDSKANKYRFLRLYEDLPLDLLRWTMGVYPFLNPSHISSPGIKRDFSLSELYASTNFLFMTLKVDVLRGVSYPVNLFKVQLNSLEVRVLRSAVFLFFRNP